MRSSGNVSSISILLAILLTDFEVHLAAFLGGVPQHAHRRAGILEDGRKVVLGQVEREREEWEEALTEGEDRVPVRWQG